MKNLFFSIGEFISRLIIQRTVPKSVFRALPYGIYGIDTWEYAHHFESLMHALPNVIWIALIQVIIIESIRIKNHGWQVWVLVAIMISKMMWPYLEHGQFTMGTLYALLGMVATEISLHLWGDQNPPTGGVGVLVT